MAIIHSVYRAARGIDFNCKLMRRIAPQEIGDQFVGCSLASVSVNMNADVDIDVGVDVDVDVEAHNCRVSV